MDPTKITGWGADRRPENRPGVPMEEPTATRTLALPEQAATEPVLKSASVEHMPPVFGTAVPPRGLSGVMRRRAYAIPEHRPSRWLLLLLADRVDVFEGLLEDLGPKRTLIGLGMLAGGLIGGGLMLARRR
jgi:hypothetical protein